MNCEIIDVIQGTPEWFAARLGHITGSNAESLSKKGRSKEDEFGAAAISEALSIAAERECGTPEEVRAKSLDHGHNWEPEARAAYNLFYFGTTEVGFLRLVGDFDARIGYSPDGLVGEDGLIEIKCPITRVPHARCLYTREIPAEHLPQIQHGLLVSGRAWCDFVSFHPDFPLRSRIWVKRVSRADFDAKAVGNAFTMSEYLDRVLKFEEIVRACEFSTDAAQLKALAPGPKALATA